MHKGKKKTIVHLNEMTKNSEIMLAKAYGSVVVSGCEKPVENRKTDVFRAKKGDKKWKL